MAVDRAVQRTAPFVDERLVRAGVALTAASDVGGAGVDRDRRERTIRGLRRADVRQAFAVAVLALHVAITLVLRGNVADGARRVGIPLRADRVAGNTSVSRVTTGLQVLPCISVLC